MAGFNDFKKTLIDAYQTLKQNGNLASELEHPTPAKLRDYCLELLAIRLDKADIPILKAFFDPRNKYDDLESAIRRFEIDKFKPLISFINDGVQTRDDKNIKLLAWMIDFQPRPYEVWKVMVGASGDSPEENKSKDPSGGMEGLGITKGSIKRLRPPLNPKISSLKGLLMFGVISAASIGAVVMWPKHSQCMYWSDDQYLPIGCQEDTEASKIAFDQHKLNTFRRITTPDTLTYYAIGKVWYAKMTQDSLVYFTGPGQHPVHQQKNLRPITKYILNKYIIPKH